MAGARTITRLSTEARVLIASIALKVSGLADADNSPATAEAELVLRDTVQNLTAIRQNLEEETRPRAGSRTRMPKHEPFAIAAGPQDDES
jgi:hypothetical protein